MSRLIDAEKLDLVSYQGIPNGYKDSFDSGVLYAMNLIDDRPIVDAVPVATAKWEHYRNGQLSCSECGENAPVIERWYCNGEDDFPKHESWGTPYCPFCGSRMVNGEK